MNLDRKRVPVKASNRRQGPYPYYGASGVVDFVDSYLFEGLHLLVAEDGENLRSRRTPVSFLADGQFWVNNHAHVLQANNANDTKFLCYALEAADISGYITGSAQPKLSQASLSAIEVPAPPLRTQQAIAATLGALDDKIESNRRVMATGESLIRTIVESTLGASEGEAGTLSDYCTLVKSPVKVEAIDPAANYIGLEHMPKGSIFLSEWDRAKGLGSNKTAFKRGDLLFGKLRPYFKKVGIAPIDGVCSTDILAVRPNDPRDIALIAVVAASDALIDSLSAGSTGTRMPRASWKDLAAWRVPVLSATERIELSARVDPLVESLTQLTFESHRLAALRDALLPELLSGRLRVPVGTP
ncbi:restriction endonuclease subunit S [Corynebacterium tapiri]|uniref:Restriction endonuclease subunit S n=1 Tax=Corynebacterium tapiri TaxID=1448266 RepID=A0A5C4U5B6_9CORY|nr:restriction endonuclease subunit S [Corynebacterium tapiri]TNL99233.1 restriction endonuclease subunit S [Corynebacterium tapiri]